MQSKKSDTSSELATDRHTAVYTRSSAAQGAETAQEPQRVACVRQAAEDGVPPVNSAYVYQEQWSGADLDRPLLGELRQAVEAGKVGVVYVYSPDRLSRNPRHLMSLRKEFASAGAVLRFVRGFSDDTPKGRLPNGTGTGIYGYTHDKVDNVPTADEQEVSVVRLVFELCLKGWTCRRIAVHLNKMDMLTK